MVWLYETLVHSGTSIQAPDLPCGRTVDEILTKAKLVHADLPLIYYHEETPDEDVKIEPFPNLAPRFRTFFIERRLTWRTVGSQKAPLPSWKDPAWRKGEWVSGMLFDAIDLRDDPLVGPAGRETLREFLSGVAGEGAYDEDVRWCLTAYLFCVNPGYPMPEGPVVYWLLPVREDGSVKPNLTGEAPTLVGIPLAPGLETLSAQSEYADAALAYLLPGLFVATVMNSPLTRLVPVGKGEAGPRGRTYDLDTDRLKQVLNEKGNAQQFGLCHALLKCRDHFFR